MGGFHLKKFYEFLAMFKIFPKNSKLKIFELENWKRNSILKKNEM